MRISALFIAPIAALALAQPATAQLTPTAGWQPWFGCWRATDAPANETLCIVPDGSGVRMVTLTDGSVRADSRIIADGQERRSVRDGCASVEVGRWSADRRRVFLTSETRCDGNVARDVSGLLAFLEPGKWMSVQTVTGDDGTATRSVTFTRVANVPSMFASALNGSTVVRSGVVTQIAQEDVSEAMEHVDAAAVQAWLRAADAPFEVASELESSGSALDQMGRMSREVRYVDRDVVRIVERPVYVVRSYGSRHYDWCWTPWGYDHYGWRAGPYIRISFPIIIHRNYGYRYPVRHVYRSGWDRDYRSYRDGNDRWRDGRDRDGWDRDGRDGRDREYRGTVTRSDDRDSRSREGSVTRGGYSSRDRSAVQREPARTTVSTRERESTRERQPARTTDGSSRSREREPARASSGSNRGTRSEPARASSGSNRSRGDRPVASTSSSSGRTARARSSR
jgi:hypothetical protein